MTIAASGAPGQARAARRVIPFPAPPRPKDAPRPAPAGVVVPLRPAPAPARAPRPSVWDRLRALLDRLEARARDRARNRADQALARIGRPPRHGSTTAPPLPC